MYTNLELSEVDIMEQEIEKKLEKGRKTGKPFRPKVPKLEQLVLLSQLAQPSPLLLLA